MRSNRSNKPHGSSKGRPKSSDNRFASGPRFRDDSADEDRGPKRTYEKKFRRAQGRTAEQLAGANEEVRLNRFLANAGICSRREADDLIGAGLVSVNGETITSMGYKVKSSDTIKYNGSLIKTDKMQYVLLNKPKGFLAAMDSPKAKKTVMDLVGNATKERIYPVGQLDRSTTGVLLLTNDGELAKRLTHSTKGAMNIYHVVLDKAMKKADLELLSSEILLEDGKVKVEEANFIGDNPREIGIRLQNNRHRVVQRLLAHLGYGVEKLDRVSFGGLTKKTLSRGHYRYLDAKEVGFLKTR